jgi:hypothetical protein
MKAEVGDWLVVEGRSNDIHKRRGQILEVHGDNGAPPYLVHWLDDDGRETLMFPGPDSHVITREEALAHEGEFAEHHLTATT